MVNYLCPFSVFVLVSGLSAFNVSQSQCEVELLNVVVLLLVWLSKVLNVNYEIEAAGFLCP